MGRPWHRGFGCHPTGSLLSSGFPEGGKTALASAFPALARCMPDPSDHFLARSFQVLQDNVRRAGPAASAGYTLIGAILLLGGVGHLVDRWAGTSPWCLLTGLLVGLTVGFYELAKTVWKI